MNMIPTWLAHYWRPVIVDGTQFREFNVQRSGRNYQVALAITDDFHDPFKLYEKFGWSKIFQVPESYYEKKKHFIDLKFNLALNTIAQELPRGTSLSVEAHSPDVINFLEANYMTGTWIADDRQFDRHYVCRAANGAILYALSVARFRSSYELIRVCSLPTVKMHKIDQLLKLIKGDLGLLDLTLRARLQFFNADVAVGQKVFGREVIDREIDLTNKSLEFKIIL